MMLCFDLSIWLHWAISACVFACIHARVHSSYKHLRILFFNCPIVTKPSPLCESNLDWGLRDFQMWSALIQTLSNLSPCIFEGPWTRPEASSIHLDVTRRISLIRSQSFPNCLFKRSVAAVICRATTSDVMGTLEPVAALPTSSISWLPKLWVSSPVMLLFISSEFGALISKSQNLDVILKVELVYAMLQYRLTYFYRWNSSV